MTGPQPEPAMWLPTAASSQAADVDGLFHFILYLCTFFFVLIMALMVYFVVKYRRKSATQKTSAVSGSHKLEIAWSVIPTLLLVVIFFWGFKGWMNLNVPPEDALEIRVLGKKWSWEFDYPYNGVSGAGELVVPVNQPVKLIMSSQDVIHSFYVPAFRIKRDVVPNRYSVLWFNPTKKGTFDVFCTEYCGTSHSQMLSRVKVVSRDDFKKWAETGGGMDGLSPVELGKKLFSSKGCVACHSITDDRMAKPGPALGKRFGKMEEMSTGEMVKVDENYVRESIRNSTAKIVKGYAPVMPPFPASSVSDRQLNALIDYIKSLK
ncbi:MAG: cytochrome c oxidase subunit II [Deltaproteobacteria bacterium]|nr:cytochrome c oxidase subunit II [Deltaproteobacteria bacterium]